MKYRKVLHIAAICVALAVFGVRAGVVSSADALSAASAWASANASTFGGSGVAVSAAPELDTNGSTVLWWNVRMSGGGLIVVAPDTDLEPIVSVVPQCTGETLPSGNTLREILTLDMRNRLRVLASSAAQSVKNALASSALPGFGMLAGSGIALAGNATSSQALASSIAESNAKWARLGCGGTRVNDITIATDETAPATIIGMVDGFEMGGRYTHWNQDSGFSGTYSLYTPGNCVCGCVAIAGSAVLQFMQVTNDPGAVTMDCSYQGKAKKLTTVAGAYGTDWKRLSEKKGGVKDAELENLGLERFTATEEREFVSRVCYNMGVLVNMMYDMPDGSGSGAVTANLAEAFRKYFGFKDARAFGVQAEQYAKLLYAQLWCGAPVIMSISGSSGGHAVVAVGYGRDDAGTDMTRVFMGWGGSSDAWYALPKVGDFTSLNDVVTMIGYENDETVPVYGHCNMPGSTVCIPAAGDAGKVGLINECGYFGIRVSPTITNNMIYCEARPNKAAEFSPYSTVSEEWGDILANLESGVDDIVAQTPEEMELSLMNAEVCYTLESAKAKSLELGRPLLMISGTSGSTLTTNLLSYIYTLDETTDFSNRFVYVFNSASSGDPNRPDGNPSIAVFDPNFYYPSGRWQAYNGRLSYKCFSEYDNLGQTLEEETTNPYLTNSVALIAEAQNVMDTGVLIYAQRYGEASLTVAGVYFDSVGEASLVNDARRLVYLETDGNAKPAFAGRADLDARGYGAYEGVFQGGETVTISMPACFTNETDGVVRTCVGWTTNLYQVVETLVPVEEEPSQEPAEEPVEEPDEEIEYETVITTNWLPQVSYATTASFTVYGDQPVTLTWLWRDSAYRVRTSAYDLSKSKEVAGLVTPVEAWVAAGKRTTLDFAPTNKTSVYLYYEAMDMAGAYIDIENDTETAAKMDYFENGTSLSFSVMEAVDVTVYYKKSAAMPSVPTLYGVVVASEGPNAAITSQLPVPKSYAVGTLVGSPVVNQLEDALVDVYVPGTFTDATGGLWCCTGWKRDGEALTENYGVLYGANGSYEVYCSAALSASAPVTLTAVWTFVDPGASPEPEPEPEPEPTAVPTPVFKSIALDATGDNWNLTVTNLMAGCTYTLFKTNELIKAGTQEAVDFSIPDASAQPQTAGSADEELLFTSPNTGTAQFWRVKVSGNAQ